MRPIRPPARLGCNTRASIVVGLTLFAAASTVSCAVEEIAAPSAWIGDAASLQPAAIVNAFGCAVIRDGHVTRPAGSTIHIVQGWAAKNRGLLLDYLQAQTTTISIDGGTPVDVSQAYASPTQEGGGQYEALLTYPTGRTLAVGESMSFVLVITLSHQLQDGFTLEDETTHRPLFFGPGAAFEFACTVTGA